MTDERVLIIIGSKSDLPTMEHAHKLLSEFDISNRIVIASAHRTPDVARSLASEAKGKGVKVIIAAAGYAAHLAGNIAAHTTLPVIGVPLEASSLGGLDSLLSTVQMPGGVPVATVTIGKAGAKNAALLAAQIMATSDETLSKKLEEYKANMAKKVKESNENL